MEIIYEKPRNLPNITSFVLFPTGMIGMGVFRAVLEYQKLLSDTLPYLASQAKDYTFTFSEANMTNRSKFVLHCAEIYTTYKHKHGFRVYEY